MILFAIKDKNTDLYVTYKDTLEPLGSLSALFKSKDAAKKRISDTDPDGFYYEKLRDDLTWVLLKNMQEDVWDRNITQAEFNNIWNSFDFEIIKVELNELQEKQKDN